MNAELVVQDEILKVDALGRVQTNPERQEALLREFENSGITGKRFAELHAIKYQTFAARRKKKTKRRRTGAPVRVREVRRRKVWPRRR